jgi:CheY-like chemotaxis protein
VFRFRLPLAWTAPEESVLPGAATRLDGLRVLVIDDDPAIREAMAGLLTVWNCPNRTAETEEEALALLSGFTPDLLLADYRLRGHRTGLEAIAAIRERAGRDLPAIVITGDTAADRLRNVHAGGTALLHKPVVPGELHAAIGALLSEADNGRAPEWTGATR